MAAVLKNIRTKERLDFSTYLYSNLVHFACNKLGIVAVGILIVMLLLLKMYLNRYNLTLDTFVHKF